MKLFAALLLLVATSALAEEPLWGICRSCRVYAGILQDCRRCEVRVTPPPRQLGACQRCTDHSGHLTCHHCKVLLEGDE